MNNSSGTTTRIAKNATLLYVRSFIVMLISLYTSRVLLRALGVEDLGIYNVVGGLVVLFAFLDGAQRATYQRFYNYAMGKSDEYNLTDVYSTSIKIQTLIAAAIFLSTEIIGLYLLYNDLVIPEGRMTAAFWVFQFSTLTLIVNSICIPFNAMIVAKEDMGVFAYIDIINVVLKLLIVFAVESTLFDRLIFYALLLFCVQVLTQFFYAAFCKWRYKELKYGWRWKGKLAKEMTGFSIWVVLSSIANILLTQGLSILYNIFVGVVANAAIGIGNQVRSAIVKLTANMSISFGPQLVINYANGEWDKVHKIWTIGSKCALTLFAAFSLPVIIDADFILKVWLENPPQYTTIFLQLILLENLVRFYSSNASTIVRATGKIKKFEIVTNVMNVAAFILIWIGFKTSTSVTLPFVILVVTTVVQVVYSIFVACRVVNYSVRKYLLSNSCLSTLALAIATALGYLSRPESFTVFALVVHVALTVLAVLLCMYFFGLLPNERVYLNNLVINIIKKKRNKV